MDAELERTERDSRGEDGRALIERLWEAIERNDVEAIIGIFDEDFVMSWPQSGERFRGRDNALAAMQAQDERPEFAGGPRIVGEGDVWVGMLPLRYGDEIHQYIGVFELSAGKIVRATEIFGAPFPPKAARARFAEPD